MKYKVNRCKFLIGPSIKSTDKRAEERPFEILNSYLYLVHPLFFNHTIIIRPEFVHMHHASKITSRVSHIEYIST